MRRRASIFGLVISLALSPVALCAEILKPGDPAPEIKVEQWVKGDGVSEFAKGKVYVVGFFASWNMLCQRSMPQLSALQTKYKDQVSVIAINTWERSPDDLDVFMKQSAEGWKFTVGVDKGENKAKEGPMTANWLRAAKKSTLPTVFIVDKEGKIAWIGDAMSLDRPLAQIVSGQYDATKESDLKSAITELKTSQQQALSEKNYDQVVELAGKIIQSDGTQALAQGIVMLKAFSGKDDAASANAVASKLIEKYSGDSASLKTIAWAILKDDGGKVDPKLALGIAQKINSGSEAWADRHLLAQAYFACAEFKRAVDCQNQVVNAVDDPAMKEYQTNVLMQFKVAAGM